MGLCFQETIRTVTATRTLCSKEPLHPLRRDTPFGGFGLLALDCAGYCYAYVIIFIYVYIYNYLRKSISPTSRHRKRAGAVKPTVTLSHV